MFGNNYCKICANAHDAINGRFCRVINDYVEYKTEPPCDKKLKNYDFTQILFQEGI